MSYIGKAPDSLVTGQSTSEDIFTATAGQTAFTITSDVVKETDIVVAINGVVQSGTAYGMSGTGNRTLTFTAGLTVGDSVRVLHIGFKPTTADAQDNSITTAKLVDANVTTAKLADNSVTSAKIAVDVIVAEDIAANAITVSELQNNAVTTAKIIDDAVTTAKILDANVTTAKLAADAVDGTKLADDACNSEHYTDGSIDTAHIADLQVTTAKIASSAITTAKIAAGNVSTASYADASVNAAKLADNAVTTAKINADAVTGAKIADDAINSEHYAAASIDAEHLATGKDGALSLDATPNTDHTANGPQTSTHSAGYTTTIMDLVYLGSGNEWLEADADATGTSINLLGIALEVKNDGQPMNVALPGSFVRDNSWNWTGGVPLYISNTPGAITATKPTGSGDVVRTVGYAVASHSIYFNPSSDYVTLA